MRRSRHKAGVTIFEREELSVMLLKKLFGSRRPAKGGVDPGEEPARHRAAVKPVAHDLKKRTQERLQPQGGFDPYNSGTFKKENAWERVTRK